MGGQGDDGRGDVRTPGPYLRRGGDAVHAGHADVHEDQVEPLRPRRIDALLSVDRLGDVAVAGVQHFADDHPVDLVVLDHQHRAPGTGGGGRGVGRFRLRRWQGLVRQRHGQDEAGTLAGLAFHADVSVHQPGQAAHDAKAQARPLDLAADRRVQGHEFLKDARVILGGDPDAGIADAEFDHPGPPPVDGDGDPAVFGELDGVADQVDQNLRQAHRIAQHRAGRIPDHARGHRVPALLRPRVQGVQQIQHQLVRVKGDLLQPQGPGIGARDVQDRIDMTQQQLSGLGHHIGIAALARVQVGGGQQFQRAQQTVQRGAHLVAHDGQHLVLGALSGDGAVAGADQLVRLLDLTGDVAHEGDHDRTPFAGCAGDRGLDRKDLSGLAHGGGLDRTAWIGGGRGHVG